MTIRISKKIPVLTVEAIKEVIDRNHYMRRFDLKFRIETGFSTMAARPRIKLLIIGRRKYVVSLVREKNSLRISDYNYQEQMGIIAHEFEHIIDYDNRGVLRLIGFVVRYMFDESYRKYIEHKTDIDAIRRGFGREVLAFTKKQYKILKGRKLKYTKKFYISPNKIKELMIKEKLIF